MAHFLSYWLPETANAQMARTNSIGHAASNQYGRLSVGDTLWLVTVWPRTGLHLLGPLHVRRLLSQDDAAEELGDEPGGLWEASYHVLSDSTDAQPIANVSLMQEAEDLGFESKAGRDRLTISNGSVSANQLQSMRRLTAQSAALLRAKWTNWLETSRATMEGRPLREHASAPVLDHVFPDEMDSHRTYAEGAVRRVMVNAYERDGRARKACIDRHGTSCAVCDLRFGVLYGDIGEDFIHVHHLRPIAKSGTERRIDPLKDLIPVCPNCHAMLHRRDPPFSPKELRKRMSRAAG